MTQRWSDEPPTLSSEIVGRWYKGARNNYRVIDLSVGTWEHPIQFMIRYEGSTRYNFLGVMRWLEHPPAVICAECEKLPVGEVDYLCYECRYNKLYGTVERPTKEVG